MNPSSYDSSIEPPRPPTVDSPSRLGDESMESSRMANRLQTGQGVDEGDPAFKFCGEEKRLPMNPTKRSSLHKSHSNDEAMDSNNSNNNNHKSTANNSLKSMLQLKSSRRSSWSNKTVDLPIATPTTLESASRQRFARRNSYVSDMVMARTRASDVISQALQVPDAGYEEAAPSIKRHAQQQQQAAPPPKRRRYQRRNSFYIPETSRSSGEASGFSWKAVDFLYGRVQPQAMGSNNTGATTTDATTTTRPSCAD